MLLLATTNQISQEIAVIPFLWVAPLSLYLLTFILTFESDRWYRRGVFAVLAGVMAPVTCAVVERERRRLGLEADWRYIWRRCSSLAWCATANWRARGPRRAI